VTVWLEQLAGFRRGATGITGIAPAVARAPIGARTCCVSEQNLNKTHKALQIFNRRAAAEKRRGELLEQEHRDRQGAFDLVKVWCGVVWCGVVWCGGVCVCV